MSSDYEMPGRDFEINIDTVPLKDGDGVDVVNGRLLGNIDPRRLRDDGVPAPSHVLESRRLDDFTSGVVAGHTRFDQ